MPLAFRRSPGVSAQPASNRRCGGKSPSEAARTVPPHHRQARRRAHRPGRVTAYRRGALERVGLLLADRHDAHRRRADTETRMTSVLDELDLTGSVTPIPGISPVGAAAILA